MTLSSSERRVDEGTTPTYTATLRDEDDDPVVLATISTITLTLYDQDSGTIINGRDEQDVKNLNDVIINALSGLLTWELQPEDTIIVDGNGVDYNDYERHVALFEWELTNGKRGKHEVLLDVYNLQKVE